MAQSSTYNSVIHTARTDLVLAARFELAAYVNVTSQTADRTRTPDPDTQTRDEGHGNLASQKVSRSGGKFDFAGNRTRISRPREQCAATALNNLWCIRHARFPHFQDTAGIEPRLPKKNVVCSKDKKHQAAKSARCGIRAHAQRLEPDFSQTS